MYLPLFFRSFVFCMMGFLECDDAQRVDKYRFSACRHSRTNAGTISDHARNEGDCTCKRVAHKQPPPNLVPRAYSSQTSPSRDPLPVGKKTRGPAGMLRFCECFIYVLARITYSHTLIRLWPLAVSRRTNQESGTCAHETDRSDVSFSSDRWNRVGCKVRMPSDHRAPWNFWNFCKRFCRRKGGVKVRKEERQGRKVHTSDDI
jgi:hypothetical protein